MVAIVQAIADQDGGLYFVHDRHLSHLKGDDFRSVYANAVPLTRAIAVSNSGNVGVIDVEKMVRIISTDGSAVPVGTLDKGAMCATFVDERLLVGDKFGDVVELDRATCEKQVIAGCVSMITDLLVYKNRIIMADRDEKIRILLLESPFIITRFMLAHTEYVAGIGILDGNLVSIGGDKKIFVWDFAKEDPIQSITLDVADLFDPLGLVVGKSSVSFILDGQSTVFILNYHDGKLSSTPKLIELGKECQLTAIARNSNDELFVAGIRDETPFFAKVENDHVLYLESLKTYLVSLGTNTIGEIPLPLAASYRKNLRKQRYTSGEGEELEN